MMAEQVKCYFRVASPALLCVPLPPLLPLGSWGRRLFAGSCTGRGQELVDFKAKPACNLFEGAQLGVCLHPNFIQLIMSVPNVASFSRPLLGPTASLPQFPQTLPEPN